MIPGRGEVPKRLFVWICGQISEGRKYKWQEKKEMSGDGASERSEEKTEFWAVATPLRAAFQPPNALGAGGRYRPSCSANFLAPSPAELHTRDHNDFESIAEQEMKRWP
jgi:hypothetical protein